MKILMTVIAAITVFLVALLVPAVLSGNLTADTARRLVGIEPPEPPVDPDAQLGPLARKLKEEQQRLKEWEAALAEREAKLVQRERILDQTLEEISATQEAVKAALNELDAERAAACEEIAKSLTAMEPRNAAVDLESFPPDDAAHILRLIRERDRGKILDAMEETRRADIMQEMVAKKY